MNDLTERKLKSCQVKPIDTVPYSEELKALKEENARLKGWLEFIATMQWGELKDCKNYAKQALNGSEVPE